MNKKPDTQEIRGVVVESLPGDSFKVAYQDYFIIAYLSGKVRQNHIRILVGDQVCVVVSSYDIYKGRITFRYK